MRGLPDFRLGNHIVSLQLTPRGSVELANVWLSADAGSGRELAHALLRREPGLALWCAAHLDIASAPSLDDLIPLVLAERPGHPAALIQQLSAELAPTVASSFPASVSDRVVDWQPPEATIATWTSLADRADRWARVADECGLRAGAWTEVWLAERGEWLSAATIAETDAARALHSACPSAWLTSAVKRLIPDEFSRVELSSGLGLLDERWSLAACRNAAQLDLPRLAAHWLSFNVAPTVPVGESQRADSLDRPFDARLEEEKLRALREFAYGASHEINNPLANIATRAQSLLRDERDVERRRTLGVIATQALRAHAMIADVMLFAKPPKLRPSDCHIDTLVDRVLADLTEIALSQGTRLARVSPNRGWRLVVDGEQLASALKSIIDNSLEALHVGGEVEVLVEADSESGNGDHQDLPRAVDIQILDTGPGIPPDVRRHLFDPYYSGREAGRGLGVGLCKAWRIITDHGGTITVRNRDSGGTQFSIRLPTLDTPRAANETGIPHIPTRKQDSQ